MSSSSKLTKPVQVKIRNYLRENHANKVYTVSEYRQLISDLAIKFKLNEVHIENIINEHKKVIPNNSEPNNEPVNEPISSEPNNEPISSKPVSEPVNAPVNEPISSEPISSEPVIEPESEKPKVRKKIIKKVIKKVVKQEDRDNNTVYNRVQNMFEMDEIYKYPKEIYERVRRSGKLYEPYTDSNTYDEKQVNDDITEEITRNQAKVRKLRAIISPEQRTEGWYKMRNDKITASDGGCVLGVNDYEQEYKFLLKKTGEPQFKGNQYTHHGKKYEKIATMIYEERLNVSVDEYGLLGHPEYDYIGASPDGIVGLYKKDGKHLTKYAGRMVEIKCPLTREIKMEGDILDICPEYYWVQVQLQLECCDLDECDFWQCNFFEYKNNADFINDTDVKMPYLSKRTGLERGCMIQLLPLNRTKEMEHMDIKEIVQDNAIYIYPPQIVMTPNDINRWITETVSNMQNNDVYNKYYVDRIIYWGLSKSNCTLIKRDRQWFERSIPQLDKMWKRVVYYRGNKDKLELLNEYIDSMKIKMNKKIMQVIDKIYNLQYMGQDTNEYKKIISEIRNEITENKNKKQVNKKEEHNDIEITNFNRNTYAF